MMTLDQLRKMAVTRCAERVKSGEKIKAEPTFPQLKARYGI